MTNEVIPTEAASAAPAPAAAPIPQRTFLNCFFYNFINSKTWFSRGPWGSTAPRTEYWFAILGYLINALSAVLLGIGPIIIAIFAYLNPMHAKIKRRPIDLVLMIIYFVSYGLGILCLILGMITAHYHIAGLFFGLGYFFMIVPSIWATIGYVSLLMRRCRDFGMNPWIGIAVIYGSPILGYILAAIGMVSYLPILSALGMLLGLASFVGFIVFGCLPSKNGQATPAPQRVEASAPVAPTQETPVAQVSDSNMPKRNLFNCFFYNNANPKTWGTKGPWGNKAPRKEFWFTVLGYLIQGVSTIILVGPLILQILAFVNPMHNKIKWNTRSIVITVIFWSSFVLSTIFTALAMNSRDYTEVWSFFAGLFLIYPLACLMVGYGSLIYRRSVDFGMNGWIGVGITFGLNWLGYFILWLSYSFAPQALIRCYKDYLPYGGYEVACSYTAVYWFCFVLFFLSGIAALVIGLIPSKATPAATQE